MLTNKWDFVLGHSWEGDFDKLTNLIHDVPLLGGKRSKEVFKYINNDALKNKNKLQFYEKLMNFLMVTIQYI